MKFSKLLAQSLVWRGVYFVTLFFVNIMLSRSLQASRSGIVFYVSNTFSFAQLVAGLCFETGITFFVAGRQIAAGKLLWFCLLWTFFITVLLLIFFHFFSFSNAEPSFQHLSRYAVCFITGLLLITYGSNLFYAAGNFFLPNLILSLFNILFIGYILTSYYVLQQINKETIVAVYFYTFLAQGICITLACIIKNKSWLDFHLPQLSQLKKFARYSVTVLLFNVLLFLVYRVDYYFVRYSPVCTGSDLGNYIQASKLGQMLLVIPQIIGSAVYPQVSSGKDIQSVSRIIMLLIKILALLFLLFFIVVLAFGNWLFPFLFGATFQHIQLPLLLLLPGIYGLAIISFISNYFSGQGNVSISVRAAFTALVVVITGDYLFVFRYGIIAAALVSSVGYLVMFTPYILRFKRESNWLFKDFFRFSQDEKREMKEVVRKEKV